jgi:hypothetical protein
VPASRAHVLHHLACWHWVEDYATGRVAKHVTSTSCLKNTMWDFFLDSSKQHWQATLAQPNVHDKLRDRSKCLPCAYFSADAGGEEADGGFNSKKFWFSSRGVPLCHRSCVPKWVGVTVVARYNAGHGERLCNSLDLLIRLLELLPAEFL